MSGRRRRIYRLTERGAEALDAWRSQPADALEEVRDAGTLKLFFGADPAKLAVSQLEAHRHRLASYEQLHADSAQLPRGMAARAGRLASVTSASSSASRSNCSSETGPHRASRSSASAPGPSSGVTYCSRPSRMTTGSRESFSRVSSAAPAAASATGQPGRCKL